MILEITLLLAMSGYREMQPACKDAGDWLCKAMVAYCSAIPDPCQQWNIDQPWHPENPTNWLNPKPKPDAIHAAPKSMCDPATDPDCVACCTGEQLGPTPKAP